jgi:pseudouridine-5'-phosphate glycosidase
MKSVYFGKKGTRIAKASRRDHSDTDGQGSDGATTESLNHADCRNAGIEVFATWRNRRSSQGPETSMDISADLEELATVNVRLYAPEQNPFSTSA